MREFKFLFEEFRERQAFTKTSKISDLPALIDIDELVLAP